MDQHRFDTRNKGYLTLLSVLIVGAVAVAIAITLLLLGLDTSRTSFANEQSSKAIEIAHGCAELALERIRTQSLFTGMQAVSFGGGACSYTIANLGGVERDIQASGTVGTVVRKVHVTIDRIVPSIRITSWQEVASF